MPDYKKMYFELFRANAQAAQLLQAAQQHAEQTLLEADPPPLKLGQPKPSPSGEGGCDQREQPDEG